MFKGYHRTQIFTSPQTDVLFSAPALPCPQSYLRALLDHLHQVIATSRGKMSSACGLKNVVVCYNSRAEKTFKFTRKQSQSVRGRLKKSANEIRRNKKLSIAARTLNTNSRRWHRDIFVFCCFSFSDDALRTAMIRELRNDARDVANADLEGAAF